MGFEPLRVYLVVDESRYFVPGFVADLISRSRDAIVGAALVRRVPEENDYLAKFKRDWRRLRVGEIVRLAARFLSLHPANGGSVEATLRARGIPCMPVEMDINRPEYLRRIEELKPDVIVSSNPLVFREALLALPRLACLNRHSSLLPSYGGVLPAFHTLRRGESHSGVSVHTMDRALDGGTILAQRKIAIQPGETLVSLYGKCFGESADAVIEALDKVRRKDLTPVSPDRPRSYYSYPTAADWEEFRRRGARII